VPQQSHPGSEEQLLVVETRADPRRTVVAVAGEIDLGTVDRIERVVADALAETGEVSLDLREVTFIDSTGLRLLLELDDLALAGGRALTMTPSATVTQLLRLTGLERRFQRAAVLQASA
jgi:anti-sigma B factor antagonist